MLRIQNSEMMSGRFIRDLMLHTPELNESAQLRAARLWFIANTFPSLSGEVLLGIAENKGFWLEDGDAILWVPDAELSGEVLRKLWARRVERSDATLTPEEEPHAREQLIANRAEQERRASMSQE